MTHYENIQNKKNIIELKNVITCKQESQNGYEYSAIHKPHIENLSKCILFTHSSNASWIMNGKIATLMFFVFFWRDTALVKYVYWILFLLKIAFILQN